MAALEDWRWPTLPSIMAAVRKLTIIYEEARITLDVVDKMINFLLDHCSLLHWNQASVNLDYIFVS
jgi:hypothetical protein